MKTKPKPKPPIRKIYWETVSYLELNNVITLEAILEDKKLKDIKPSEIRFNFNKDYGYGEDCYCNCNCNIEIRKIESDEELKNRQEDYEYKLAKWQKWYDKNKNEIETQELRKKEKAEKAKKKLRENEKIQLEKNIILMQKKLAKLK